MRASLAAAIGLWANGCSFTMLEAPPARHESLSYFDCTSSRAAPALDAVLATAAMAATLQATTDDSEGSSAAAVLSASLAGAALASLAYGFVKTEQCADAKRALEARAMTPPVARPPLAGGAFDPWLAAGPPPYPAFLRAPVPAAAPPPDAAPAPDGGAP